MADERETTQAEKLGGTPQQAEARVETFSGGETAPEADDSNQTGEPGSPSPEDAQFVSVEVTDDGPRAAGE